CPSYGLLVPLPLGKQVWTNPDVVALVDLIQEIERLRDLIRIPEELFPELLRVSVLRSVRNAEVITLVLPKQNAQEPFPTLVGLSADADDFHFTPLRGRRRAPAHID